MVVLMVVIGLGIDVLLSDFQCGAGNLDINLFQELHSPHQVFGFIRQDALLLADAVFEALVLSFELLHHFYGSARVEDVEEFCAVFSPAKEGGFLLLVLFQRFILGHETQELVFVLPCDAVALHLVLGGVVDYGILAGLSNLPIVNFFTSSAKKVTDSDWTEQESTLESKIENLSLNFKNSTKGSNMHNALHISPYFIPGMKLGDILFPIAAVVAHSRRIKVECRIPWAYSEETRELHAALGMNALPSTLCGANEALAYEEESYLYTPIPETVASGGLCGYFQSGNYFAGIEPVIRHLFAPLTAVDKTPGTVGIHITIGNDPYKYSKYRLRTALFLQKAAARLSKDIREVVVFSDKPCEAVAMLVEFPEFAQYSFRGDQSKPCEQLRRMTAMQELVISNSALSWWAAWLGKPCKVIAPRCWFMHKAEQPPVFDDSPWIVL